MTILITLAVFAAAVGAIVSYVAWRDRHRRDVHIDPSVSRDAVARAEWHIAQSRAADTTLTGTMLPRPPPRRSS